MDWRSWHEAYDNPTAPLALRLQTVQAHIRAVLSASPPGPLRVVSICAGQGRDLIGVLADHPRRGDVRARLVELDDSNTAFATESARVAGLARVEVVTGDASLADAYRGTVPAEVVLFCGVFGNITDADIERAISFCPQLCRTGGSVIWTRNRRAPDRVPLICERFEAQGFERASLSLDDDYGVGTHRFIGESRPLAPAARMFTFVGYDKLPR